MTVSRETSDQARQARRERIAAGKPDPDDCTSETEIICPYCGDSRLGQAVHSDIDKDLIPYGLTALEKSQICANCGGMFIFRLELRRIYHTRIDRIKQP